MPENLFYDSTEEDHGNERETKRVKQAYPRDEPKVVVKKEEEEDEDELEPEEEEDGVDDELPEDGDEGEEELDEEEEERSLGQAFFKVGDRVPPPTSVYRSIKEIFEMVKNGNVNLNPSYQRDSVWKTARRQALIDSLFNNRPVMSLYFAVSEKDGVEYRNVIDGKQRLTTLKLFLSGLIPYKDKKNTSKKDFYWRRNRSAPKTGYLVPPEHKAFFEEVKLECVEYHDLPLHQEEAIFKAIQQGMVLVTGEKSRVGDDSARRKYIRELAEKRLKTPTKKSMALNMDVERGRDFTNLASFIYCAAHLPDERARPTNDKLNVWLDDPEPFSDELQERINLALDDFWEMVSDYSKPFTVVDQKLAPVEVVFTLMFLYITKGRDLEERSEAVLKMRRAVHTQHKGVVRSNATVYAFLWHQIDDAALKYETRDGNRLPDMPDPQPDELPKPAKPAKKRTPRKKVAPAAADLMEVDDDDEDDEPLIQDNGEGALSLAAAMNDAAVSTPAQLMSRKRVRMDVDSPISKPSTPKQNGGRGAVATPASMIKRKDRKRIKAEGSTSSRGSPAEGSRR